MKYGRANLHSSPERSAIFLPITESPLLVHVILGDILMNPWEHWLAATHDDLKQVNRGSILGAPDEPVEGATDINSTFDNRYVTQARQVSGRKSGWIASLHWSFSLHRFVNLSEVFALFFRLNLHAPFHVLDTYVSLGVRSTWRENFTRRVCCSF